MGNLSAAMLSELASDSPVAVFLLEIDLPTGTVRFSDVGAIYAGVGMYEARILSWGSLTLGVTPNQESLELFSMDVELEDRDFFFTKIVEGASGNAVRNSVVRLKLASPAVAPGNWYTVLTGRLASFDQPRPLAWRLSIAPNDLPLQREALPRAVITRGDWPNADASVIGKAAPIVYGKWSSVGGTDAGCVPTYLVDKTNFYYLVCAGRAMGIDSVYVNGTPTGGISTIYPVVNGRIYTCLDYTAAATITCDMRGYDTNGDGTGSLIEEPALMLSHCLTNWCYNDYKQGAFLGATSGAFNSSWETAFFSDRSIKAGLRVDSRRKGIDVINDWLRTFSAKAFWKGDGTISLAIEDPAAWAYQTATAGIVYQEELEGWVLRRDVSMIIDRIDADYLPDPAASGLAQYLTVSDLQTGENAPESRQMPYSVGYIT